MVYRGPAHGDIFRIFPYGSSHVRGQQCTVAIEEKRFSHRGGFLDFVLDFRISRWISGFLVGFPDFVRISGFPDFAVDFWISRWISGFQIGFLDFVWISRFFVGFLDFALDFGFLVGFLPTVYEISGVSDPSRSPVTPFLFSLSEYSNTLNIFRDQRGLDNRGSTVAAVDCILDEHDTL